MNEGREEGSGQRGRDNSKSNESRHAGKVPIKLLGGGDYVFGMK